MNKQKALTLLSEVMTFYFEMHKESELIKPTNKEIGKAEKYIEDNLK